MINLGTCNTVQFGFPLAIFDAALPARVILFCQGRRRVSSNSCNKLQQSGVQVPTFLRSVQVLRRRVPLNGCKRLKLCNECCSCDLTTAGAPAAETERLCGGETTDN